MSTDPDIKSAGAINDHKKIVNLDAAATILGTFCKLGTICEESTGINVNTTKGATENAAKHLLCVTTTAAVNLTDMSIHSVSKVLGSLKNCTTGTGGVSDLLCPKRHSVKVIGVNTNNADGTATGGYGDMMTTLSALKVIANGAFAL